MSVHTSAAPTQFFVFDRVGALTFIPLFKQNLMRRMPIQKWRVRFRGHMNRSPKLPVALHQATMTRVALLKLSLNFTMFNNLKYNKSLLLLMSKNKRITRSNLCR